MLKNLRNQITEEFESHPTAYILLAAVLLGALFVRVYRAEELMRFYYDQGRDALVIWRLWHEGDPFLVGPVTGLSGIFLGPLYYYLIAPFYLIGGGNPVYPAYFLAFLSVCALFIIYYLGKRMHSRAAGIIAAAVGGFSYYLVLAGRWLANPTPILFTSVVLLWSMWEIISGKSKWWWIVIAATVGASLQLEAASAVFYLPVVFVFGLWTLYREGFGKGKKSALDWRVVLTSFGIFLLSLTPQVAFNFVNDNILFDNFRKAILQERSFSAPPGDFLLQRLDFLWGVFSSKLYPGWRTYSKLFTLLSVLALLSTKSMKKKKVLPLFLIFLGIPLMGYLTFQGNFGNFYDYYLTGYYLPMVLLFSLGLGVVWKKKAGKIAVAFFLVSFFMLNGQLVKNYLTAGVDGPTHISLGNELQAVDFVFEDAEEEGVNSFNVDVYVPPVIPHSYDYLFLWQGTLRQAQGFCGEDLCGMKEEPQLPIVYVLYEVDPPHPERLNNWLAKYKDTTIIEEEERFGGITVQRRKRL